MKKRKVQTVIFHRSKENKKHFLLLKMRNDRGGYWQSVTGGVDKGESFEDAALREAIEETQIKQENILKFSDLNYSFEFHDRWGNDVTERVFSIECKKEWDVIIDPSEHTDFNWVCVDNINENSVHFPSNYQALVKVISEQ